MSEPCPKELERIEQELVCEYKTADVPASTTRMMHCHDVYELYLFLNGDVNQYTERSGKKLERGDLLLMSPYVFHGVTVLNVNLYDRIVINVSDAFLSFLGEGKARLMECFRPDASTGIALLQLREKELQLFTELALQLQQELSLRQEGARLMCRALFAQLLVHINRWAAADRPQAYPRIMPDFLARTFAYINEHLREEITLQQLADNVHHNGAYLSRSFKNVAGLSLTQYITAKRVALAQQLLREGHAPSEACYLSGFNNYSNFSRTFSK